MIKRSLPINREESWNRECNEAFENIKSVPLNLENDCLRLDILVDQSAIAVFANDGIRVSTDPLFPETRQEGLQLYAVIGKSRLMSLELFKVR